MSAKIFISHSSADHSVARTICTALENRGLRCWIASRDVGPGENFQEAIVRAIRAGAIMVLVFTENANNSPEIKKELVLASQNNLVIIPVRVENVAPNDALAYEFATRQWIDLFANWEHEIERLGAWIARILAGDPQPLQAARVPVALRAGSPTRHFAAALLIIFAAFLFVLWLSLLADGRSGNLGSLWQIPPGPMSIERLGAPTLFSHVVTGVSLILIAAITAAGFGTIGQRSWSRLLGLGFCTLGLLAFAAMALASGIAVYQYYANEWNQAVPVSAPKADIFTAILSCLFVIAFVGAAIAYFQNPRRIKVGLTRSAVFGAFALSFCTLTLGAMYVHQFIQGESEVLWSAVLIAFDAVAVTYCCNRFRKQFGALSALGPLQVPEGRSPG